MKSNKKRLIGIALGTAVVTIVALAFTFTQIERPRPVSEIEITVAKLPLGITAEEADSVIGSSPDSVHSTLGVLVTPVTMLAASNELAKQYGEPQAYSMRIWERDGVNAVVAVDSNGTVAGRWTWRPAESGSR